MALLSQCHVANALVVGIRFEIAAIGDIVEVLDILETNVLKKNDTCHGGTKMGVKCGLRHAKQGRTRDYYEDMGVAILPPRPDTPSAADGCWSRNQRAYEDEKKSHCAQVHLCLQVSQ